MHGSGLQILLGDLRVLNFSIKCRLLGWGPESSKEALEVRRRLENAIVPSTLNPRPQAGHPTLNPAP